ncbi:metallophosphoesterase [Dysgonomonas sp. GY75]|uniref:metallophosphoesterase family protein n=1 Tax=Dysgonomonas sp. GY75 TaxID=2780419 RepID=UPI0018842C7D|nr:metallophosphoesterase [Dysgonomonas sp. GY75]MBF0648610.1 metallophosphoesterase [Dysgonomonas sp. GY75]
MTKTIFPCVLMINDIHISKDNIPDFNANWNEALQICEKLQIKLIALGGDLFQSRAAQALDVLLAVYDALADAEIKGIAVVITNGNHDLVDQEAIRGYCHVFGRHANVTVVDDFLTLTENNWDFALHMIAYFPESGSFTDKLNALIHRGLDAGKKNYLYIHEGINGALAHPSDNELPAHIFSDFDRVFAGHYHDRTVIPGTNIEYIGSSRQHNFGEDEEKGYTILYTDGTQEFIKNKANTRFMVLDIPVEKVNVHLKDRLDEVKADGKYKVKVRIHCDTAEANNIDKNELIQCGASKVEVVTKDPELKAITSTSLFEKFDSNKIQENYQQFCQEKNIEDVSLGLSYLAKIDKYVETN